MKKPGTRLLILVTAAIFVVSAVLSFILYESDAANVEIYEGGTLVGEYPLNVDRTVTLSHNTVKIENGSVYMSEADCKNRICVNTGAISSPLYPIVCLPNRVMVLVSGGPSGSDADAVAGD